MTKEHPLIKAELIISYLKSDFTLFLADTPLQETATWSYFYQAASPFVTPVNLQTSWQIIFL